MDPNLDLGPSSEYTFSSNNPLSFQDGRRKSSLRDIESQAGTLGLSIVNSATNYAAQPNAKSPDISATEKMQRSGSFAHLNYVKAPQPTRQSPISL